VRSENRTETTEQRCVNAIRALAMDAVEAASSGHPGTPMALAPLGYVLWTRHLRHDPVHPEWPERDRFVLSCGHASMLLYSLLYLSGYDLEIEDLRQFRQWQSRTPGHPEYGHTPGVETTTGPLGQGVGNAVGMALTEAHLAAVFNRPEHTIVDHTTWFVASDGDLMEGISHEAASLAGHLRLGKLIGFYDDNRITIDGPTELALSDDAGRRFEAYGWHVQHVEDGNDLAALDEAIVAAKATRDRPSLIIVRTHIAYGSPNKQDTAAAHGAPLGAEEVRLTKERLGWPASEAFAIPDDVLREWRCCRARGAELRAATQRSWEAYAGAYPDLARELERRRRGERPAQWRTALPRLPREAIATRSASGKVLNALAPVLPELIGGSADLAPSNNTLLSASGDLQRHDLSQRNLRFGVREHAMGAVLNGMALHGGVLPYGGTFLVFSDYMRPAIRLAALMGLHVIYVFTHDSIGLGEDGPTHQPIEMLAALRAIPNLLVLRPADAIETTGAWQVAIEPRRGPVALALTRQNVPPIPGSNADAVACGGYVVAGEDLEDADAILLASGSEVSICVDASTILQQRGVMTRVVSMPSLELFASQPRAYRDTVLPPRLRVRVAVEAAHPMPWYRWVGEAGDVVGLERFGASAPATTLFAKLGLDAGGVAQRVLQRLRRASPTT
jgi:transketolase